ncbi:MAG: fused response regulator/phosphatase [Planctomycetales bacterium]|nr:fused response regulator/phosphatase [Planctomycetales bacterium]
MRVLVGWDDVEQADLISLYLSVDASEAVVTSDPERLIAEAKRTGDWDVILMTTLLPDIDGSFAIFEKLRQLRPGCPVVCACEAQDVFRMARFMSSGMRTYVLRDAGAEFIFLLQAMLETVVAAVHNEREQKIAERLREEVDSVRKLQESITPRDITLPAGYQIVARYEPSQMKVLGGQPIVMAGGDYYDIFRLDDSHIVLLVGDASGHGMKACMSIMTMHTLARMIRNREFEDPATFVVEINRHLCEQSIVSNEGGFITMLYGVLNTDRHELRWCSAGHPIPLLQDLERNEIRALAEDDAGGLPLAITPDAEYETHTSTVPAGSRLLLYTDGLAEAFPEGGEVHAEFGLNGILGTLKRLVRQPLADVFQTLFDESNAFTQGSGRHDDTSVVLLEHSC